MTEFRKADGIYLDNAAACPLRQEIMEYYLSISSTSFVNQESAHAAGKSLKRSLDDRALESAFSLTGSNEASLYWVNSATEAMASLIPALNLPGLCLSSKAEHQAFSAALKANPYFSGIRQVPLDSAGQLNFSAQSFEGVSALALHHVQGEIGALQDLRHLSEQIRTHSPKALMIADTVQSFCKIRIPWDEASLDYAFISGHKAGAPGGAAVLFRRSSKNALPLLNSLRFMSHRLSRPEPALSLALARAIELNMKDFDSRFEHVTSLNRFLRQRLAGIQGLKLECTVPEEKASPYILNIQLHGFQSAIIARMLSDKGIYVSSGTACESESKEPSPALSAMGKSRKDAYSGLRVSFWHSNTLEELSRFADQLERLLKSY